MDSKNVQKYLEIAKKIVIEVGDYLKINFGGIKRFKHKSKYHIGISEDIKAYNIYKNTLKKQTPEVSMYTEEGEKDLSKNYVWVIDSLDGTSNYKVGIPLYVTQICLLFENNPIFSIIYAPSLNLFFTAEKNKGSYLNGKIIKTSDIKKLQNSLISIGKGTKYEDILWMGKTVKNIMGKSRTFRHLGSTGLELSYVASGKIDAYINKGNPLYDYLPGLLMVKESGGIFTDYKGEEWNINQDYFIASNGNIHNEIINLLNN